MAIMGIFQLASCGHADYMLRVYDAHTALPKQQPLDTSDVKTGYSSQLATILSKPVLYWLPKRHYSQKCYY